MNNEREKSGLALDLTHAKLAQYLPFLAWMKASTQKSIYSDFLAALTGLIVVLPQGVAYALIAGVPPEYGLYTAIIVPIVTALFGSSWHLISGPAAAISIVVLSIASSVADSTQSDFISAVLLLTFLVGVIQFGLGIARLGVLVNFISHTVVIGFTAGAALLIATSQFKYVLGVKLESGLSFLATWNHVFTSLGQANVYDIVIAASTIVFTLIAKRLKSPIPPMLLGMLASILVCFLLQGTSHNVSMVGAMPSGLPVFYVPNWSQDLFSALLPGATALAILGLVEAVSISRAIAIKSGQRIDGNQEFIGQGLANMIGSFFSCHAASGSFTRSGVNYDAGARTPLAALFTAFMLILVLWFVPNITAYLPLSAMGGAIMLIAWNLIDSKHIHHIFKSNRQESIILLVTFFATLFMALEFAIYLGVLVSLLMYLKRTSQPRVMNVAPKSYEPSIDLRSVERFDLDELEKVKIIRIDGSIFFGAVNHIQKEIQLRQKADPQLRHILIHGPGINFIDLSGAEMLEREARRLEQESCSLYFCALKNTVMDEIRNYGLMENIGEDHFFASADDALSTLDISNKDSF
ncbi:SulP family inorganic anion transporter [Marinomonas balearica]|uniref:SulP family sulfate permease n=1 Tax=Marinomonas balearica TaxID=491947 RepID=A0A4R6MHM7_9GAMM|nr:SulP family inorganic anion transporter [Marinomonas balearica]TDP01264.1 SulP family sulfate permease [Marinomonas balearica]